MTESDRKAETARQRESKRQRETDKLIQRDKERQKNRDSETKRQRETETSGGGVLKRLPFQFPSAFVTPIKKGRNVPLGEGGEIWIANAGVVKSRLQSRGWS